jgi:GNAT superfamily N-acetyltransferase
VSGFPPVRRLGHDDLKSLMALATDRGWLPDKRKWQLLLDTAAVFGVGAPDGQGLAGSVTLARYGPLASGNTARASVGMMLVASRYGRRGLGRTLMAYLLDAAGQGTTVTLFATAVGRPLYEKLGFKPVGRSVTFTGSFRPGPERDTRIGAYLATGADLPELLTIDQAAFGADRSRIISRLPGFTEKILISRTPSGISSPTGYAAIWRSGETMRVIGPVIAPDGAAARHLITELAAAARGHVRLDLDPDRPELPAWAEARGLALRGENTVMAYGPWNPPEGRSRIWTPITVALT